MVIGILIALQVNNWNEHRKLKQTQNNYLLQLADDIDFMQKNYKGLVQSHKFQLDQAREVYRIVNSCEISNEEKVNFDNFFFRFNSLGVLYYVSDTYEEMLSANLVASIEDKDFKNIISEFFTQRDAMQIFIDQFQQNLNLDYKVLKEHVVFGFDSLNQPTLDYEISELCNSKGFKNAVVEGINAREATYQMVSILSGKLEQMQAMLNSENKDNLE